MLAGTMNPNNLPSGWNEWQLYWVRRYYNTTAMAPIPNNMPRNAALCWHREVPPVYTVPL